MYDAPVSPRIFVVGSLTLVDLACFVDPGSGATADPPPASTSTTSTDPTTTAPTTGTTTTALTTTAPATTTTDIDLTTSTTTTTTSDPTTDDPPAVDCWARGTAGWPITGTPLDLPSDDPTAPRLTADGLTLIYTAGTPKRPHRATRADRLAPFLGGSPIAAWPEEDDTPFSDGTLDLGDIELLVSDGDNIRFSLKLPDGFDPYTAPLALGLPVNTPDQVESYPNPAADGSLLLIQRDDGPPFSLLQATWRFWQYDRPDATPGGAFSGGLDVTPIAPPLTIAVCPALAPDGLHLFFTSFEADAITADSLQQLDIYYTRRDTIASPWQQPERLPDLNDGQGITCAASVTADGCTLTVTKTELFGTNNLANWIADRSPNP